MISKISNNPNLDQKGQTFVEFVLLLATVMGISIIVLRIVNNNLAELWKNLVVLIVDDPTVPVDL